MFLTCGSIENLYNRGIAGKKLETQEFLARDYDYFNLTSMVPPDAAVNDQLIHAAAPGLSYE